MRGDVQRIAVVGASLGGLGIMQPLLAGLRHGRSSLILCQHRSADVRGRLVSLLEAMTVLPVVEPDAGTTMRPGTIYLAPTGYHLLVEGQRLSLDSSARVGGARPSIDLAFRSAARTWGQRCMLVLMTSSSIDGVQGLQYGRERGARVAVQDPDEAASDVGVRVAARRLQIAGRSAAQLGKDLAAFLRGPTDACNYAGGALHR